MGVAASASSVFDCATNPLDVLPSEGDDSSFFSSQLASNLNSIKVLSPIDLGYDVPIPLRSSSLWTMQRSFYEQHASRAWTDGIVPHFVSSNSFIARAYAKAAIGLLRDLYTSYDIKKADPPILTILEVGAGHGKLGYLIVESLLRFRAFLPPRLDGALPFRYVLTDAVSENIEAMRIHPSLRDFFSSGAIDAGVWNAEEGLDDPMRVPNIQLVSGSILSSTSLNGAPLLVVANYAINSLRTDAFRVPRGSCGGLEQANVTLSSIPGSLPIYEGKEGDALSRIGITWSYSTLLSGVNDAHEENSQSISLPQIYLDDPLLKSMLIAYSQGAGLRSSGGTFLFPLGGIAALRSLLKLSSGRLVVLIGDKGHSYLGEMVDAGQTPQRDPHIALHGSFSFMVNFHALRQWVHAHGGASLISPHNDGFKACLFAFGGIDAKTTFSEHSSSTSPKLKLSPFMFPAPTLQTQQGKVASDTYGGMLTSVAETMWKMNEKHQHSFLPTSSSLKSDGCNTFNLENESRDVKLNPIFAPAGCSLSAYPFVMFPENLSIDNVGKDEQEISLQPGPNGFYLDDETIDVSVYGTQNPTINPFWNAKLLTDFAELRSASLEIFNSFTPEDFATLQRGIKEESPAGAPSLKHALALLRLSQHDSEVFLKFKQVFIDKSVVPQCPENQAKDLRFDVERVYAGFFPLQLSHDVNFELARICMGMRDHASAIEFFNQSNKIAGEHHVTWHNLGICFFFLNDHTASTNAFTRALSMNPNYSESANWLSKVHHSQAIINSSVTINTDIISPESNLASNSSNAVT